MGVPRVLDGKLAPNPHKLGDHHVEHLRARAHDDARGIHRKPARLPQVSRDDASQPHRTLGRRRRKHLPLRLRAKRLPQCARPQARSISRERRRAREVRTVINRLASDDRRRRRHRHALPHRQLAGKVAATGPGAHVPLRRELGVGTLNRHNAHAKVLGQRAL